MKGEGKTVCPICSSKTHVLYSGMYDDRHGYRGFFTLRECRSCSHRLLQEELEEGTQATLYTRYYPRSNLTIDQHGPHAEVRGFKGWMDGVRGSAFYWVPRNVRILDIGCGFGESLAYHRSRGCDVYGVEADENIRKVAERFGYQVHVGAFDPAVYEPGFFDYVTMDQVLEHVIDPVATLRGISRILKDGGIAVLSTPNANSLGRRLFGRRWIHWHTPYHLQFFSKKSMTMAARQAGLKVNLTKTITSSEWLYYQWLHLLTVPPMGTPSPFWSPSPQRQLKHPLLYDMCIQLHKTKINHAVTRFLDLIGAGDNYLFFLQKE